MRMNTLFLFDAVFQFDWLSLVLVLVLTAIPVLEGSIKGASHMFFRFIAGVLVILIAYYLAKPVAVLLDATGLGGVFQGSIYDFLASKSELASTSSPGKETLEAVLSANNYKALTDMHVPSPFAKMVADYVVGVVPEEATETAIGTYVAMALTTMALSIIGFLIVWLILTIVFAIVHAIIKKRQEKKGIRGFSRFIGILIGVVVGVVNIAVAFYAVSLLSAIPVIQDFLNEVWGLDNPDVITIGKTLYEANLFQYLTGYFL